MANGRINKIRTTREQLSYFVAFTRTHPDLWTSKYCTTTSLGRELNLWDLLAEKLNGMSGPKRSAATWKKTLTHWKHQLHCRARQAQKSMAVAGQIEKRNFVELALASFGSNRTEFPEVRSFVEEQNNLQREVHNMEKDEDTMGLHEVIFQEETSTEAPVVFEVRILGEGPPSSPSTPINSQNTQPHEECEESNTSASHTLIHSLPSLPEADQKVKYSSNALFKNIVEMLEKRDEREEHFQQEILTTQKAMADGLKSLGEGIQSMAEAMKYLSETLLTLNQDRRRTTNGIKPS